MEREQLVGPRFGDESAPDVHALAVSGSTLYAGGDFTTAGGSAANNIAQWNGSSWSALGSGMGGNWTLVCLRWRCRAARCMRAVISRRRAAARPITSRNGTGAVGRRSVRGWTAVLCVRWRCRAARCMRAAISRRRAASRPITSRNGTGAVGRPSVRG